MESFIPWIIRMVDCLQLQKTKNLCLQRVSDLAFPAS